VRQPHRGPPGGVREAREQRQEMIGTNTAPSWILKRRELHDPQVPCSPVSGARCRDQPLQAGASRAHAGALDLGHLRSPSPRRGGSHGRRIPNRFFAHRHTANRIVNRRHPHGSYLWCGPTPRTSVADVQPPGRRSVVGDDVAGDHSVCEVGSIRRAVGRLISPHGEEEWAASLAAAHTDQFLAAYPSGGVHHPGPGSAGVVRTWSR